MELNELLPSKNELGVGGDGKCVLGQRGSSVCREERGRAARAAGGVSARALTSVLQTKAAGAVRGSEVKRQKSLLNTQILLTSDGRQVLQCLLCFQKNKGP